MPDSGDTLFITLIGIDELAGLTFFLRSQRIASPWPLHLAIVICLAMFPLLIAVALQNEERKAN
jgi:hypothetical protein